MLPSWNEGRAVKAIAGLREAARSVIEAQADAVTPADEGKLVHIIGQATAQAPVTDAALGLRFSDQVLVARNAQM